ncbi:unnamed protein product [Calicophoron daubneyi]|uniref:dihydrofolate reductase n=1 Tax=Calicophoron daubneyi TaxID=300641 RepID=A0AAV2T466_CALDB
MPTLNIIAAVSLNGGIGYNGGLPWKLRKDMTFFATTTTMAKPGLKNAVVMGRKTWECIPEKVRPLKNRINMILSTTMSSSPPGTYVCKSLAECLNLLESEELKSVLDKVFVIGGSSLYKEVLEQNKYPVRIYCTHVMKEVECDTFFPQVDWSKMKKISLPEVPEDVVEENGYSYKFCVYDKVD